ISRLIVNWCLLPGMWEDGWQFGSPGYEHGLFAGHFHGNTAAILGMLDYAVAAHDKKILEIVREAYEHGRQIGMANMGWFPVWTTPDRFGRPGWIQSVCDNCTVADMCALAIALSEAGVGDYWDDIDHYVRNQLTEAQLIDRKRLESIAQACSSLTRTSVTT